MALGGLGQSCGRGEQQEQQDSSSPESSLLVPEDEALRTESLRAAPGSIPKTGPLCHHADIPEIEKRSGLLSTAKERGLQSTRTQNAEQGGEVTG